MDAPWTDLGGGVLVRQSVAFQMNSVALLDRAHTVLIDPGVLPSELDDFAARVGGTRPAAITLLFTHAHWDHVLGKPWWPHAATLAHDKFYAAVRRDEGRIRSEAEALAQRHGEIWERSFTAFRPSHEVSGVHVARLGPWTLVVRGAPGHSDSHLTAHLAHARLLIAADMLSDVEIPTLEGPCGPYLRTLRDLAPLAENGAIETLIPGHGSVARGRDEVVARVRRDVDYLGSLEREVQAARRSGLTEEQAAERLGSMLYGGAAMPASERDNHLANVRAAFRAEART